MSSPRHLNRVTVKLLKRIDEFGGTACEALPEMFFPQGDSMEMLNAEIRIAKNICAECPVKRECLDYAIEANEPYGIFGGQTPSERMSLAKARRSVEPSLMPVEFNPLFDELRDRYKPLS